LEDDGIVAETVLFLLKLSIAVLIACVGAGTSVSEIGYLWKRPGLMFRSLTAMYLLVPLVACCIVLAAPIDRGVKATLLTLAVSAGAPLLPRRLDKLDSHPYIFSLLMMSSLVAIVAVPLWAAALSAYFDVAVDLSLRSVTANIGKTILLPILLGMGLRFAFPATSERWSNRVMSVAWIVLAVSGILLLILHRDHLAGLTWQGIGALVALMIAGLVIGQILGGPDPNDRAALAIACSARHIGIALVVAAEFVGPRTLVLVVAYFVTSFAVAGVYFALRRRRVAALQ
jgi:predicted Na+-dependent transporter